jgi:hypothetical protein
MMWVKNSRQVLPIGRGGYEVARLKGFRLKAEGLRSKFRTLQPERLQPEA